jgi:hypothetical protein
VATTRTRRFGLLDAMILVGAIAIGLVGARLNLGGPNQESLPGETFSKRINIINEIFYLYSTDYLIPLLFTTSCATVVLCLRHSRPQFRRLASSPGFLSLCVAVTFVLFQFVTICIIRLKYSGPMFQMFYRWIITAILHVGLALLPMIFFLRFRRHRSRSGWTERLALILGLAWVGLAVLQWSLEILMAIADLAASDPPLPVPPPMPSAPA